MLLHFKASFSYKIMLKLVIGGRAKKTIVKTNNVAVKP